MAAVGTTADDPARVLTDTDALADVLRSTPDAAIACYDGWAVTDLAVHVGQIHRWVTGIVTDRAAARPTTPYATAPPTAELSSWLRAGARALVAALAAADPDEEVWTISRGDHSVSFWRRRMVLETALHRWDAESAAGRPVTVDPVVAHAGVGETLDVYLAQRLDGADIRGQGERVAFIAADGDGAWTLSLSSEAVRFELGSAAPDAVVEGPALELWLLLTGRAELEALAVRGDREAAALAVRAAGLSPGPAG